jgi:hypothetical protein
MVNKSIKIFWFINCIMVEIEASVLENFFVSVIMLSVDVLVRETEQILKNSFLVQTSAAPHFRRL